jgi:hypothetical protein
MRQGRLGIVGDCSLSWLKSSSPLPTVRGARWWPTRSPPPSSTWYKNDPPKDPSPSSSFPSPGRMDDSLSLNEIILPHRVHVLCLDSSTQNARAKIFWKHGLPITYVMKPSGRNRWDPNMLSLSIHPSLSSGLCTWYFGTKHHPRLEWCGTLTGTSTWCSGLTQSPSPDRPHPNWQDATFVLQDSAAPASTPRHKVSVDRI